MGPGSKGRNLAKKGTKARRRSFAEAVAMTSEKKKKGLLHYNRKSVHGMLPFRDVK